MRNECYFDENGIVKLEKDGVHPVENTPLFHITYLFKNKLFSEQSHHCTVLNFLTTDLTEIKGSRSHDNMTAILTYLCCMHNFWREKADTIKDFKILPDYTHPRDFLYIAYLQRRWWIFPLAPLIYVMFLLIFGYMAVKKYKVRGGRKIFKTDTEILYWIRLQLPKKYWLIHATKPFIVPLLKMKYGDDWFMNMMDIYYKEEEHPNRERN